MKQQTAMQLLFAEFKSLSETARFSGDEQTANLIDFLCEREPIAIKKEQEQITLAYYEGVENQINDCTVSAQEYFNQTYNNQ